MPILKGESDLYRESTEKEWKISEAEAISIIAVSHVVMILLAATGKCCFTGADTRRGTNPNTIISPTWTTYLPYICKG